MLGRTRHVHFVGIGGSGMSGIAELLANLGYHVSGSDARPSTVTTRLASLGVTIHVGHEADQVVGADVVVASSAIVGSNPELAEAARRRIPVIPRAEMLAELMRLRYGIAVAGSHGKTSTTSMIAVVLEAAGLDPTAVIGGRLSAFGSNARLGRGDYMVAEADESDRSFLKLTPAISVITNVDDEHLEAYGTFDRLLETFVDFANRVPFYGAVVLGSDAGELRNVIPKISRRVITFGLESDADLLGLDVGLEPFAASCQVHYRSHLETRRKLLGRLRVQVPGRHNLQNALAATAVGLEVGIEFDRIAAALAEFRGAERRFELCGEHSGVMVVDDYGHHPTEIAAVIAAARAGLGRRIVAVFQPHRYSRTARLLDAFGAALGRANEVVLTEVYGAGEPPIAGATAAAVAEAVRRSSAVPVHTVGSLEALPAEVAARVRRGDVVITFGAGSIGGVAAQILDELRRTADVPEPSAGEGG